MNECGVLLLSCTKSNLKIIVWQHPEGSLWVGLLLIHYESSVPVKWRWQLKLIRDFLSCHLHQCHSKSKLLRGMFAPVPMKVRFLSTGRRRVTHIRLVSVRDMREESSGFISGINSPYKKTEKMHLKWSRWSHSWGIQEPEAGTVTLGCAETATAPFWLQTTAPELCWRKESCSWCLRES